MDDIFSDNKKLTTKVKIMYSLNPAVENHFIEIKRDGKPFKFNQISVENPLYTMKEREELIRESVSKMILELAEKVKIAYAKKMVAKKKKEKLIQDLFIEYIDNGDRNSFAKINLFGITAAFVCVFKDVKTGKATLMFGIGDPDIAAERAFINSMIDKVNDSINTKRKVNEMMSNASMGV